MVHIIVYTSLLPAIKSFTNLIVHAVSGVIDSNYVVALVGQLSLADAV